MRKIYLITITALLSLFANDMKAQRSEVTFYTTKGNFKVLLTDSLTPVTVDSFLARVSRKFYDGLIFHRVIPNFMIQGGDPLGTGSGGTGTKIPDEFHPSLKNVSGKLSMANTGTPNTGDCQFFINVVTNSHLDNKHTVFGEVTQNYSVVDTISKVATAGPPTDKPLTDVKMDSIRVTKWPVAIKNISGALDVALYPNPNNGQFTISLPSVRTNVRVLNAAGQTVYTTQGSNKLVVDLQGQVPGIYLIHLDNKEGSAETKILIQ